MNDQKGVQPMIRSLLAVRSKPWAIAIAVLAVLASAGAAPAWANSEIEGVWLFDEGKVAINPVAGQPGKYEGIVVSPIKFAECEHVQGEHMWTDISEQSDGSFWGLHQWFHGAPDCQRNPALGPTAWRVVHEANGVHFLYVCFSLPSTNQQPTISPDGAPKEPAEYTAHHVNYGCVKSKLIAPLPVVSGAQGSPATGTGSTTASVESLTLPSARQCLRPGRFTIRLKEPKYDPFSKVTVVYRGRRLATAHRGHYIVATVNLRGLSKHTFTVKVRATTVLGHHLSANRTYHLCRKTKSKKHHRHTKKVNKKG